MRKTLCILLILSVLFFCSPTPILAKDAGTAGGTCGAYLTWSLSGDGILTISGTGPMDDYYAHIGVEGYDTPWYDLRENIRAVVIEPGVTVIGQLAFGGCGNLTDVTIPDSVTVIRNFVFDECTSLETVVLPDTLTTLGSYAFTDCTGLTGLTIPEGVTEISDYLFRRCTALKEISIPDSAGRIGKYAFTECSALERVHIGSGVTEIGNAAFYKCISLTTVSGMEGVVSIGNYAFCDCVSLAQITVPAGVTYVGNQAFYNCNALADENGFVIVSDVLYGYIGSGTHLVIPDGVTAIGGYVFNGNSSLESVVLPDSVTSVGAGAFRGCSGLADLSPGSGLTRIGSEAFQNCSSLTGVTIPAGVTAINRGAFDGCTALEAVFISDLAAWCGIDFHIDAGDYDDFTCNPLYCAQHLYLNGEPVTDLVIPENVTAIGRAAFCNAQDLVSVTFPETLTEIGEYAFFKCAGLTKLSVPGSVAVIGERAFFNCSGLKKAVLGSGVELIEYEAFSCCTALKSITLPDSITFIGDMAFYACKSLSSVTLPAGLMEICPAVFLNCFGLASVIIPESVNSIGSLAFSSCKSLTEVTIPASVEFIGGGAFHNCVKLTDIWFAGDAPDISDGCFELVTATAHYPQNAHWPKSLRKNYGGTLTWKAYIPVPELRIGGMSVSGVRLEWNAVDGAEKYQIQRKSGSGSWESLKTVKSAGFTDASAQMGETYRYRLRAYVNGTWSEYSSPVKTLFNPFSDVPSSGKTLKYVSWAYNNGIVSGTSAVTFDPDISCTRIQFVMMLWKMHGSPVVSGTNPFTDISGTKTTNAILWALDKKLINSGTSFNPGDNITRINIVMMLWKLAGSPKASGTNPFTDVSGSKTTKAVLWAYRNGITTGTGPETFSPDADCTRLQLVVFLYKYNDLKHVI